MKAGSRSTLEKLSDRAFITLTGLAAMGMGIILGAIVLTVAYRALPAITTYGIQFLVTTTWDPVVGRETFGILPMIAGTLVSSALALAIALPLGIGTAIFLTEDFLPLVLRRVLALMVDLLAAIPSVVYGLWGIFVLIPLLRPPGNWLHTHLGWVPLFNTPLAGPGMLPAAIVLAIMILPLITAISRDSLEALSTDLREAAVALGATRWYAILRVLLPAATVGIGGGTVLALGRAMGETMAVTLLIGNSNRLSPSLLAPANTIASLLANQFTSAKAMQVSALMYAGLVLLVLTLGVNLLAEWLVGRVRVGGPG